MSSSRFSIIIEKNGMDACVEEAQFIEKTAGFLLDYFIGENPVEIPKMDFSGYPDFKCKVLRATMLIPYGETRDYGWIARVTGKPKATRAVGRILSLNPVPILVPCHRVVCHDGSIGGYIQGNAMKKWLIENERES
ncbi:MAG: methylated-DNA--[protein]-cysteine S-methyltransferase [Actinomycetota bacterium]|nr:methylated-DNA--[protein]-cysteine S-methyltransferase [Actinomycetota bacterium]